MKLFIGIDLGTSGCRAVAIDEQHNIHGEAAVDLPAPIRNGTHVEQNPNLWWDAFCDCLDSLLSTIDASHINAIAVDGTSATLLLTDAQGTPLGPALMYNDARASQQAETIARIAPTNTAAQGASCALAKLLWLNENGLTATATHAIHQADWIAGKLCDKFGTSDYNNALKLGFDAEQKIWPEWLTTQLSKLDLPQNLLPKVVAPGSSIGCIETNLAQRFRLPASTNIIAGTTDSTASFLATGAHEVGEAVTALGSTLVVKVIAEQPVFAAEYGVYSQPLMVDGQQRWLVGGASNSGGAVLRQHFNNEHLQSLTAQLKPDQPTGLNYYPLPSVGERFPINDVQLEPRLDPRPDDNVQFLQGILEGIADIEAQAYQLLAELGAPYPVSVRTTGGGAKNKAWTQIREQRLQTQMLTTEQTQAAFGTALLATTLFKNKADHS